MSNNMIWLIGAGNMAVKYAEVLSAFNREFEVIGRGEESAKAFTMKTGIEAKTGGLENLPKGCSIAESAVIAVDIENLVKVAIDLIELGIKRILIEKPVSLEIESIKELRKVAEQRNVEIFVAYNRRFFPSVVKAKEIIENDGGVKSFHFDFTERVPSIVKSKKSEDVKKNWLVANSTHLIDMAFFLGGTPVELLGYRSGTESIKRLDDSIIHAGMGYTDKGALFTYEANWGTPGNWKLELNTKSYKLIFNPLEELKLRDEQGVEVQDIENYGDKKYKLGLVGLLEAFLSKESNEALMTLDDQIEQFEKVYLKLQNTIKI